MCGSGELVEKERKASEEIANSATRRREYKEFLKTNEVNYGEAHKKATGLRRSYYNSMRRHRRVQSALYNFPIVPIIIPTPVDVNWSTVSQMV